MTRASTPTMRPLVLLFFALSLTAATAHADDRILLQEILPILEGTELGRIEIGDAPPPGTTRTVRRSEILAALKKAGKTSDGLALPTRVKVERSARVIEGSDLERLVRVPAEKALSPCRVVGLLLPPRVTVPAGELGVKVEGDAPPRSGLTGAVASFSAGGKELRVPIRATVECPPPIVAPGHPVRVIVRVGQVVASAPGEVRQPGRIGDVIRVTNKSNGQTLQARVVDAQQVEVVR